MRCISIWTTGNSHRSNSPDREGWKEFWKWLFKAETKVTEINGLHMNPFIDAVNERMEEGDSYIWNSDLRLSFKYLENVTDVLNIYYL